MSWEFNQRFGLKRLFVANGEALTTLEVVS